MNFEERLREVIVAYRAYERHCDDADTQNTGRVYGHFHKLQKALFRDFEREYGLYPDDLQWLEE